MNDTAEHAADLPIRIEALVRAELEARRIAISRELATIPPPVPACDVDFNRLLEDRGRIADDLLELGRLVREGADPAAVAAFCRDATTIGDALKARIAALAGAPTDR